jgi:hypothetical protein
VPRTTGTSHFDQLGIQRQDPAVLGPRGFFAREGTILHFIDLQLRGGLHDLLHARRIVHAR